MANWLYRHIFRGAGIVLIAGMITILMLAIYSQRHPGPKTAKPPPAGQSR